MSAPIKCGTFFFLEFWNHSKIYDAADYKNDEKFRIDRSIYNPEQM